MCSVQPGHPAASEMQCNRSGSQGPEPAATPAGCNATILIGPRSAAPIGCRPREGERTPPLLWFRALQRRAPSLGTGDEKILHRLNGRCRGAPTTTWTGRQAFVLSAAPMHQDAVRGEHRVRSSPSRPPGQAGRCQNLADQGPINCHLPHAAFQAPSLWVDARWMTDAPHPACILRRRAPPHALRRSGRRRRQEQDPAGTSAPWAVESCFPRPSPSGFMARQAPCP